MKTKGLPNLKKLVRGLKNLACYSSIILVTACANQSANVEVNDDLVCSEPGIEKTACPLLSDLQASINNQIPEYAQQILPIHERAEVIEQEIEDARKKD